MYTSQIKIGNITTSKREILDLIKAWVVISMAFAIMQNGGFGVSMIFLFIFIISAITAGLGFLLHEFVHKIVAQRYGCFAEFRSFDQMLILTVILSFFGFIFAAPGAVFITGNVGRRRNGIISAAGPATNIMLAVMFLILIFFFRGSEILHIGFTINTWLALFNMIPFGNFDGEKILRWSKTVYISMVIIASSFMLIQAFL